MPRVIEDFGQPSATTVRAGVRRRLGAVASTARTAATTQPSGDETRGESTTLGFQGLAGRLESGSLANRAGATAGGVDE